MSNNRRKKFKAPIQNEAIKELSSDIDNLFGKSPDINWFK